MLAPRTTNLLLTLLLLSTALPACELFRSVDNRVLDNSADANNSSNTNNTTTPTADMGPDQRDPPDMPASDMPSGDMPAGDMPSTIDHGRWSFTDNLTANPRASHGLILYYTFEEGQGAEVLDRSQVAPAINLQIDSASWISDKHGLRFNQDSAIASSLSPPAKIYDRLLAREAFTLELWIQAENTTQQGPARILTLSESPSLRNLTVGPDTNALHVRMRSSDETPENDYLNGIPARELADTASTNKQHILVTFDGEHLVTYVDSIELDRHRRPGTLLNWDRAYNLALGNELTNDRPWRGDIFLLAIYERPLRPAEVRAHFLAGDQQSQPLP